MRRAISGRRSGRAPAPVTHIGVWDNVFLCNRGIGLNLSLLLRFRLPELSLFKEFTRLFSVAYRQVYSFLYFLFLLIIFFLAFAISPYQAFIKVFFLTLLLAYAFFRPLTTIPSKVSSLALRFRPAPLPLGRAGPHAIDLGRSIRFGDPGYRRIQVSFSRYRVCFEFRERRCPRARLAPNSRVASPCRSQEGPT